MIKHFIMDYLTYEYFLQHKICEYLLKYDVNLIHTLIV